MRVTPIRFDEATEAEMVRQEELENLIGLRNLILELQQMHRNNSRRIMDRLARGASIEPGTHIVRRLARTLQVR